MSAALAADTEAAFALAGPAASPQLRLLDEIEARLRLMTLANGYRYGVKRVTRATLKPFIDGDLPGCNFFPGQDTFVSRGAGFVARELALIVEYYTKTRDQTFADVAFELALDVQIALRRSVDAPTRTGPNEPTLGGRAQGIELNSITPHIGDGQSPWCGAQCAFAVSYRVRANDPTVFV